MDNSVMLIVSRVHVSAGCEQRLHQRYVAVDNSEVERRQAISVSCVRQGRRGHQHSVRAGRTRSLRRARAAGRAVVQGAPQTTVTYTD